MKNALICALLTFLGYGVATVLIAFTLSGEVLPSAFAYGVLAIPIVLLVGGVIGGLMSKVSPGKVVVVGLVLGLCLPPFAYFAIAVVTSSQHAQRNAALHSESMEALKKARADGLPFPPDVTPFLPGDVRSELQPKEVLAFYDSATKGTWIRHQAGGSVSYVRRSKADGMVDRINPRAEYGQTTIYFGTLSHEKMKLSIAGSFGSLVKGKDWASAAKLCTQELQQKLGPSGLKEMLLDVDPDSTGFVRQYYPNGAIAPIAINAQRASGGNSYSSAEIGFEFTDDLIPQIKRIEF